MAVDLGCCQARPEMYQLHEDMDGLAHGVQVSLGMGYSVVTTDRREPQFWSTVPPAFLSCVLETTDCFDDTFQGCSIATIDTTQVWTYSR